MRLSDLDRQYLYLLPEVAYREANRVQPLKFTVSAIGTQLREDGHLVPGNNSLTVQRRVRGNTTRFWRLKSEILGCDDCDTRDDD